MPPGFALNLSVGVVIVPAIAGRGQPAANNGKLAPAIRPVLSNFRLDSSMLMSFSPQMITTGIYFEAFVAMRPFTPCSIMRNTWGRVYSSH
ncbi:MAG: hypothetical protein V3S58_04050 [Nitrosomonadaceae bacterium]